MIKKCGVGLAIAASSILVGSEEELAFQKWKFTPQPGYWYNNTDSVIEVRWRRVGMQDRYGDILELKPHKLTKMMPFEKKQYNYYEGPSQWGPTNQYTLFIYNKKGDKLLDQIRIDRENFADLDSNYVIIFNNSLQAKALKYSVMPEKEFREKYARELEAYPVPGGIQRIIGEYFLPAPEKTKA